MTIWIDDDACPGAIREIVFRASRRLRIAVRLVSNRSARIPEGGDAGLITSVRVPGGFDEADRHIAEQVVPGDLVVTADIPLAAKVVDKGALGLDPRGEVYSKDNVQARLTMRNFMQEMRSMDLVRGGPPPLGPKDKHRFAAALEHILASGADSG